MRATQNILSEYEQEPIKRSRFYIPTIILLGIFSCFLVADMFIDIESLTWTGFDVDWVSILLGVVIPVSGLAFFIAKKRIGWFISTTFISFIAFAIIGTLLSEGFSSLLAVKVRQIFITTTAITASILLQTMSIRAFFKIKNLVWVIAMTISLCLTILVIFFG